MRNNLLKILVFLLFFNLSVLANGENSLQVQGRSGSEILIYDSDKFRDPFLPQVHRDRPDQTQGISADSGDGEGSGMPEFSVQGMVWNSDMPQAIINGQVYRVGDKIEEAQIIDIDKEGVRLLQRGKIYMLRTQVPLEKR